MTTQAPRNGALLDHTEAAGVLKCSPSLVRKLIRTRQLETVKIGALTRIEIAAIDRYIAAHRRPAAS